MCCLLCVHALVVPPSDLCGAPPEQELEATRFLLKFLSLCTRTRNDPPDECWFDTLKFCVCSEFHSRQLRLSYALEHICASNRSLVNICVAVFDEKKRHFSFWSLCAGRAQGLVPRPDLDCGMNFRLRHDLYELCTPPQKACRRWKSVHAGQKSQGNTCSWLILLCVNRCLFLLSHISDYRVHQSVPRIVLSDIGEFSSQESILLLDLQQVWA